MSVHISRIYVDQGITHLPETRAILDRLKHVPCTVVFDYKVVQDEVLRGDDPVTEGKRVLFLTRNKGAFLKDCPGTKYYNCCGYKILHIGTYCYMDCSYCILQTYFNPPVLQYFMNQEDLLHDLDRILVSKQGPIYRIGTGEFTDSLIWEPWTDISMRIVPYFAAQERAVLELKSKTVHIKNLKYLRHNSKTIVAFSINTPAIIKSEERYTASLKSRIGAAAMCEEWGYPLAFHFDPLILYDGCEPDYREVIRYMFKRVSAENIVWISLGTFRFMPPLKRIIQQRFPGSKIIYGEFIPGLDNKMRYFKPLRIDLYKKIVEWIREVAPDVLLYFCMEDDDVWHTVMGHVPEEKGGLPQMLDEAAIRHCRLTRTVS
nr:DNA photolyase [Desulfobacterales bacterium]